jgi:RHH-type proline utilization regulon transcriptional repressor/proline dehydrogenase/delta 1-pyrroline-5-carboxylate dehydrogenase
VLKGLDRAVATVIEAAQPGMEFLEFDLVRAGAQSDERAWQAEYGVSRDVSALGVERNVFRYRPVPVTIRLSEQASPAQLVRVIAAAARAGSTITVSSAVPLAAGLLRLFRDELSPVRVLDVVVETDAAWHERLGRESSLPARIRLIGGDVVALAEVVGGSPDVAIYSGVVTTSGRIELLPFLHEQAISMTAHRFGNPDPTTAVVRL